MQEVWLVKQKRKNMLASNFTCRGARALCSIQESVASVGEHVLEVSVEV